MRYLIIILLLLSCNEKKEVSIYKRIELDTKVDTLDIISSTKMKQSLNHIAIYDDIVSKLNRSSSPYSFIVKNCSEVGNGWSLKELKKRLPFSNYRKILAPLHLKLKAKYPNRINVVCSNGDDLLSLISKLNGKIIVATTEMEALKLEKKLSLKKIAVLLLSPYGFTHRSLRKVVFSGVPFKFDYRKFPLENLLPIESIMSLKEKESLKKLMDEADIDFKLLLSDFDKDGYRDFTVSSNDKMIIINNEDRDWDNDGVQNILDTYLKETKIGEKMKVEFENFFESKTNLSSLLAKLKSYKVNLLVLDEGLKHNISVIKTFVDILEKVDRKKYRVNHLVVKVPKFKYGKEVFFSYNKKTLAIEYYPLDLNKYLLRKKREQKLDNAKTFYFRFIKNILIHSLSHELMHSRDFDTKKVANDNHWSIKTSLINSLYLQEGRHKFNILNTSIGSSKYKDRSYKAWLLLHQKYVNTVNQLLASKGDFVSKARVTPWYTNSKSKRLGEQMSFLNYHNIPSLYATHSPSEWLAEMLSMCLFNEFFPKIPNRAYISARYELTLGINPRAVNKNFCSKFEL